MAAFVKGKRKTSEANKKTICFIIVVLVVVIIVTKAIVSEKWIYLSIVFSPFLIYLSIKKPFIFPFGLYVCLLPFDSILAIGEEDTGATVTKFLGVASILSLFITGLVEKKFCKPDKTVTWWGLFIVFGCLSIWWAIEPELTYERIPTAIGLYLLYLIISSYKVYEKDFELVKKLILYGGVVASIYTTITYFFLGLSYRGFTQRASMISGGREADPNQFAINLLIPFSLAVNALFLSRSKFIKILNLSFVGIILFCILITGSRGGLLGIISIILFFVFSKGKKIYVLCSLIVPLSFALYYLPEKFFQRITQDTFERGVPGRVDIWKIGLVALKHYWVLGAGLGNFSMAYTQFDPSFPWGSHNIYLCVSVELGIIGFFCMIIAIYKHFILLKDRGQHRYDSAFLKASLCGLLISSFSVDTIWLKSFWLIWILTLIYNNIKTEHFQ